MNFVFASEIIAQVKIEQTDLDKLGKLEWGALWPAWVAGGGVLVALLADLILPKTRRLWLSWVAFGLAALAGLSSFWMDRVAAGQNPYLFQGMVSADEMGRLLAVIIFGVTGLVILASPDYLSRIGVEATGEYYALVLAASCGMWLLTVAAHFMVFFIALELFSLALYILAGFLPRSVRSHEAGFKYFLLSSFASAFLLYGIALLFGATGTTGYAGIQRYLSLNGVSGNNGILVLFGLALLCVGFAFKISAIPFHMWTPDVYEGAPTPITALMAVGTKAAIVAAFLRVFSGVFGPISVWWQPIVWVLAVVTMVGGNLLAISQSNIKRMLSYSAIAHAGYLLVGLVANNPLGRQGLLFYLLAYSFMTLGAFAVVIALEGPQGEGLNVKDFAGLNARHPLLAAVMAVSLLSLGGIPPTAGFFGKALVFGAAVQSGGWNIILVVIGVVTSVAAIFYYFRIVIQMYMRVPDEERPTVKGRPTLSLSLVLVVAVLATVGLGFLANFALDWATQAATAIKF